MIGLLLEILSIVPFFIVNIKFEYDKAVKKHKYCAVFFFLTQYFISKDMSKLNHFFNTCVLISTLCILYSIPLYLKNKDNFKVLKDIVKWNLIFFTLILILTIITCLQIN